MLCPNSTPIPSNGSNLVGNAKNNLFFEEVLKIGWSENFKGGLETRFINSLKIVQKEKAGKDAFT